MSIREDPIRTRSIVIIAFVVLAAGVGAYFVWSHYAQPKAPPQLEYVVSPSLDVLNTPAVVHETVAILKYGDRVEILRIRGDWAQVRVRGGAEGWISTKEVIPAKAFEAGQKLLHQVSGMQAQATGHATLAVNIHVEPGRDAPVLGLFTEGQNLDVFNRRVIARNAAGSGASMAASTPSVSDVWYLVRSDSQAGWVLGRMIALDIPEAISQYAANSNVVAWFVLDKVRDGDAHVPQYLVADREGTVQFDYTRVRVFTWSRKTHHYVTSFVQGGLKGIFPIRTERHHNVPYFRLRLVANSGEKYQGVYGLFRTIVRHIGRVDGWESNAMPGRR
ncbi:MAG: SH3 domain-containing protein [Acidobacteriota bacterium]